MVVAGATDVALARLTADSLARCYGLKPDEAAAMLETERTRRAADSKEIDGAMTGLEGWWRRG